MRCKWLRRVVSIGLVCTVAIVVDRPGAAGQGAAAVTPQAPQATLFRVVRSTSGSKGHVAGSSFIVEDPRTVFRVPDDRQVIVHLEWEGPAGAHRMEGLWRNPEGRVSTISEFAHTSAGKRFGAYWELALPASAATGTWTLEARIDGQPAGVHSFEIIAGDGASLPPVSPAARAPLTSQELYKRIQAATVKVEKLDGTGRVGLTASGFAIAKDRVVVPFNLLDGASALRLTSASGQTEDVTRVVAFDRAGDWALLPTATLGLPPLERPAKREAGVGTTLYGLNVTPTGERTFVDAAIGGTSTRPVLGERLLLSVPVGWRSAGTPVIDAYGQAIAVTGAVWEPGTAFHDEEGGRALAPASALPLQMGGTALAIPIERVVDDGKPPRDLAALAAEVPFTPMFGPSREHLIRGLTAQSMKRGAPFFEVIDQRTSFSKARGTFALVLELMPKSKMRNVPIGVTVFTLAGRAVGTIKAANVKSDANRAFGLGWTLDANVLQPGVYRLDVGAPGDLMWRTFVEITP
jgi:hypothetical protein